MEFSELYADVGHRDNFVAIKKRFPPGVSVTWEECSIAVEIRPIDGGISLSELLSDYSSILLELISKCGALIFRDFSLDSGYDFKHAILAFNAEPMSYTERSTPRSEIDRGLYTVTEYPAREPIFLHNESSYAHEWPRFLCFFCEQSADIGGEVNLADTRKVYQLIPDSIRHQCEVRGLRYVRRFIPGLGYSWQDAFSVASHLELTHVLSRYGYRHFHDGGHLIVERNAQWTAQHSITKEHLWFNHGVFFNGHSLSQKIRDYLSKLFGPDVLPFQTFYGDGSPIEKTTYEVVRDAYLKASHMLRLVKGDVLLIDNQLIAHGRNAFTGMRKHYVVMFR